MKLVYILFFFLFFICGNVIGQYEPMAVEGTRWVLFQKDMDFNLHHTLSVRGDTIIDGTLYKKMYRREILNHANYLAAFQPPYYYENRERLVAVIRDDVDTERVYAIIYWPDWIECSGEEELIHDFSLTSGSLFVGSLYERQDVTNSVVDSIKREFVWGKEREIQVVRYNFRKHEFIEGVGGVHGPFSWNEFYVVDEYNEMVNYCIGPEELCDLFPTSINEINNSAFKIFPIPAHDIVNIRPAEKCIGEFSIKLTDTIGKVVLEEYLVCQNFQTYSLPLKNIPAGVYILNFLSENNMYSQKVIVQ